MMDLTHPGLTDLTIQIMKQPYYFQAYQVAQTGEVLLTTPTTDTYMFLRLTLGH